MYNVITKKKEGTTTIEGVSTGFHSRAEAGRFAAGLAKTGRVDSVQILHVADESVEDMLRSMIDNLDSYPEGTEPDGTPEVKADLARALLVFTGDEIDFLRMASDAISLRIAEVATIDEPALYHVKELITKAIGALIEIEEVLQ